MVYIARHISNESKVLGLGILEWYIIICVFSLGIAIPSLFGMAIPVSKLIMISVLLYICFRLLLNSKSNSYYLDLIQFHCHKKGIYYK